MSIITLLWLLLIKERNQVASKSEPIFIVPNAGICGNETTLTCKTPINVTDSNVEYIQNWDKDDLPLIRNGKLFGTLKSEKYKTESGHGQISLRIFNTSISDQGYYKCTLGFDWSIKSYLSVECVASSKFATVTVASSKKLLIIIDRLFPGNVNISASLLQQNSTSTLVEGSHSCQPSMETQYYRCQWNSTNPIKVGAYKCSIVIKSVTHTVELVKHLDVPDNPQPSFPSDFHHIEESVTGTSVTLQWSPGYGGNASQVFIIEYKKTSSNEWHNVSITESEHTREHMNYTLTELSSGTEYQMRIYARNFNGTSNSSSIRIVNTKDRPFHPSQFHHTAVTDTSVTLQWRPGYDGGLSQTFVIEYKKASSIEWQNVSVSQSVSSSDYIIYALTGLSSETEYQLKIYGWNSVGKSNTSEVELIKTQGVQQDNHHVMIALFAGSVGGLFGLANLITVIIMFHRSNLSKERSKLEVNHLAGMEKPAERKEVAANSCDYGMTENLIYALAVEDSRVENAWNDDSAHTNDDHYAVVHEQPEPEMTENPSYESGVNDRTKHMLNGERVKRDLNIYNVKPKQRDQGYELWQSHPSEI